MPRDTPPERETGHRTEGSANSTYGGHRSAAKPRRRLAHTRRAARELLDQLLGRTDRGLPR